MYLYAAPSFDAPLIDDPALPGPGTTLAPDWGDKAATGQQFYRAESQGDWDAIYYGGQKAWFYNPGHANSVPGNGVLVTPKADNTIDTGLRPGISRGIRIPAEHLAEEHRAAAIQHPGRPDLRCEGPGQGRFL